MLRIERGVGCRGLTAAIGPLGLLISVTAVVASAVLASSWWRFCCNAFSDLGYPAPGRPWLLFDGGLVVGGLLVVLHAAKCCEGWGGALAALLGGLVAGIGIVNESIKPWHFIVSLLFFIVVTVGLLYYAARRRLLLGVAAAVIAGAGWGLFASHILCGYPPGVAPAEAIGIAAAVILYAHLYRGYCRTSRAT